MKVMTPGPIQALSGASPEDRRRFDQDDLLVVEDAEVAQDSLDVATPLVRVPAVDRGVCEPSTSSTFLNTARKKPLASWMSISR